MRGEEEGGGATDRLIHPPAESLLLLLASSCPWGSTAGVVAGKQVQNESRHICGVRWGGWWFGALCRSMGVYLGGSGPCRSP